MRRAFAFMIVVCCAGWQTAPPHEVPLNLEYIYGLVANEFYDANQLGAKWDALCREHRPKYEAATSPRQRSAVINELLAHLGASHTEHTGPWDPHYYHLNAVFHPDGEFEYPGIGIEAIDIDGQTFVRWVYDGTPANKAGLRVGDEIVAVDDQPYGAVESFRGRENGIIAIDVRRTANGPIEQIDCAVVMMDGSTMFLDAQRASAHMFERGNASIAYVHVWSYAGEQYQDVLEELLLSEPLSEADALVLDVRGGLGGAQVQYLNIFNEELPMVEFARRGDERRARPSTWTKPAVLLVDETSRSGKEVLAYGFKKIKIGPVVGARTAGAVLAGQLFPLMDGTALYLAVSDVRVDGERLEGVGIAPDIEVPFQLPYANGSDPRLERALSVAAELAIEARSEEAPIP